MYHIVISTLLDNPNLNRISTTSWHLQSYHVLHFTRKIVYTLPLRHSCYIHSPAYQVYSHYCDRIPIHSLAWFFFDVGNWSWHIGYFGMWYTLPHDYDCHLSGGWLMKNVCGWMPFPKQTQKHWTSCLLHLIVWLLTDRTLFLWHQLSKSYVNIDEKLQTVEPNLPHWILHIYLGYVVKSIFIFVQFQKVFWI